MHFPGIKFRLFIRGLVFRKGRRNYSMGSYQRACPKHWECCVLYCFRIMGMP